MTDPQVRVRYAPSPTGMLHVGGVRTALFNWLFAKKNGGAFVLRIEDTDLERSTEESVEQLKSSLRWIGLDWDEGPEVGGPHEPYRQTERLDLYKDATQKLLDAGHAYYDFATPEELTELRKAAQAEKRPPIYTGGEYREMDVDRARKRIEAGEAHTVRFKTPRDGTTIFQDMIRGEISFENSNLEDFVIMKSSGTPTYNFAAAVDDATMNITHVIRGDDHISNTPRQILIYHALGYPVPPFAHVPQVLGPDKKKLSKRHGAASAEEFAAQGVLPEALFNYLALLGAGYAADEEIFSPDELAERFRIEKVSGNPAVFDETKLLAVNATYIRKKSPGELAMLAAPELVSGGVATADEMESDLPRLTQIMELLRERIQRTTDMADSASYFYGGTLDYDEAEFIKQFDKPFVRENFSEMVARLKGLEGWNDEQIEEAIRSFAAEKEKGARHIIHPVRFAATGRTVSAGLFETLTLLGRERTIARLEAADRKMSSLPA
ncbi:glutamate--tRNA ligase [Rubrobacter indicoceani]|uniref:glutamate--tRNA ligase n=1 Tax=Rubrobacter indicoceani TaxID=2051957 RepID=UPI000E5BD08E|nr:glutamate--tRNA ligase [Rubrobacter indicoceani]